MSRPKLIVFDVDGTIVDSKASIIRAMRSAHQSVGIDVPDDRKIVGIVGLSLPEAMRALDETHDDATIDALVEAYRGSFVRHRAEGGGERSVPLYDGAHACLTRLASVPEYILGTATGKARRGLDVVISAHGLEGMFQTLQTADLHPSKPHPAMLHAAMSETGIDAADTVMIGDTTYDMDMGRAAGCATIGVAWGYHMRDRLSARADVMVETYGDLDGAIATVLGGGG